MIRRLPGSQNPVQTKERTRMLALYDSGLSLDRVARETGRAYSTVHRVVEGAGRMRKVRPALTEDDHDRIYSTYARLRNVAATARAVGRGVSTVQRVLADAEISTQPRFSAEDVERMAGMYRTPGVTINQVAQKFGCSYGTAHRLLAGREVIRSRRTFGSDDRGNMLKMYQEDGLTIRQIAAAAGCSYSAVRKILSDAQVLRPRGTQPGKAPQ